ncbi:MAG: 3-phosphoserine/phosphohydroxythreonine transaminase [Erysipelotrichaceae bacterium]|nr:3-phosphoserine/phosphohydroxythreonine transaminase [Erysipelotrichaceae bacterium]
MENRVYNFAAGPSMLADDVLKRLKEELFNYNDTGMSVMEMSHRSKIYLEIYEKTKADLKKLMGINEDYEVFFMHGGATGVFASLPMNLLRNRADYIVTGNFSNKAAKEAMKYGQVNVIYDGKDNGYARIPDLKELFFDEDADYIHLCANNTIYGTEWKIFPDTGNIPLIADMSSDILSRKVNVSNFGMIYAGAQKNMGIAGLAVIIIKKDLIKDAMKITPSIMDYVLSQKNDSMLNTPATYPLYVLGKVLEWLDELGGIDEIEKRNIAKAKVLYDYLDSQSFYKPHAEKDSRSLMNVTFTTPDPELDALFASEATKQGMVNLKGHRLVGGIRASIYNAMPAEGVNKLVTFMDEFRKEHE